MPAEFRDCKDVCSTAPFQFPFLVLLTDSDVSDVFISDNESVLIKPVMFLILVFPYVLQLHSRFAGPDDSGSEYSVFSIRS